MLIVLLSLIGVIGMSYALLRTKKVQTWSVNRLTAYLSNKLQAEISIGGLDIDLTGSVVLEQLSVKDQQSAPLFFVNRLGVSYRHFDQENNSLSLGVVSISNADFQLKTYAKGGNNLDFLINYFSSEDTSSSNKKPFQLSINTLHIENSSFAYTNEQESVEDSSVFDIDLTRIQNLNLHTSQLSIINGKISTSIKRLSLQERCGFRIENLRGYATISDQTIEVKQFFLETPNSIIQRYVSMRYKSWDSYADFFNKVRFYTIFENSTVGLKDIGYFTPYFQDFPLNTTLNGTVSGPLAKLESKVITVGSGLNSSITTSFQLKGLPEPDKLYLTSSLKAGRTNPRDVNYLCGVLLKKQHLLPYTFDSLGTIFFEGNFKGLFSDFKTKAVVKSIAGNIDISGDLAFNKNGVPEYNGFASVQNFDLGNLFRVKSVGKISAEAQFSGRSFSIKDWYENTSIAVSQLEFNHYNYQNIRINGEFDRKLFQGAVEVNDKNLGLAFKGSIDFNQERPAFNFSSTISAENLQTLHLYENDAALYTSFSINASGNRLNNVLGSILIPAFSIRTPEKTYTVQPITCTSERKDNQQLLTLNSPIADLTIEGVFDPASIVSCTKQVFQKFLPSYHWGKIEKGSTQAFQFSLQTKNLDPVTELFLPELKIKSGGLFRGEFNSFTRSLSLSGNLANVQYKNINSTNVIIDEESTLDRLDISISCDKMYYNDSLLIVNAQVSNTLRNDSLLFNIKLGNYNSTNSFDLNGQIAFNTDSLVLTMLPSIVNLNHEEWQMNDRFNVHFGKERVLVDDFSLSNQRQTLSVSGVISKRESEGLIIRANDIDLSVLNPSLKPFSVALGGVFDGTATIFEAMGTPKIVADFSINDLVYNQTSIAKTVSFQSDWNQRLQELSFTGNMLNKYLKPISVSGKIFPEGKQNLDIHLITEETDLAQIEPFTTGIVSKLGGTATANIQVNGTFKKPVLNGSILLQEAITTVDYLQTRLLLDNRTLQITNNQLKVENLILTDESGKQGVANGRISFADFSNPYFDIDFRASELLCLNTKATDNNLYYGKARASGRFSFEGTPETMNISIQATTARGTQFFIPLSSDASLGESGLVTFVNRKDTLNKDKNVGQSGANNYKGITLNMDLDVNDNAQAQLIFDKKTGDIMKGTGNGNLKLRINTLGDFEMYGEYEISEGEYLFTLQNLINKRLKVSRGSTIRWNGDPYQAQVNMTAVYQTTAKVLGLYQAAEYRGKISATDSSRKVAVDCKLLMQNNLFSPDVSFDLDLPRNPEVKNELASYLNNKDNVNSQVLSLLIASRFTGDLNAASGASAGTLEVLSNQLSNYLSNINKGLNVNINSLNGAGGTYTWNRINISGNVVSYQGDASNATKSGTQRTNSVTGDVTAEYKISKSGNFRVKAFNKTITNDLTLGAGEANQNIQGLGILYRADFDNIGELWRKIWGIKPKDQPVEIPVDSTQTP